MHQNGNIKETLDHILSESQNLQNNDELLLVCGSFFIMTDVRRYFGINQNIDRNAE